METITEKWNTILETVKTEHDIIDVAFKTWLLPLKVHSVKDGILYIIVPNNEFADYIKNKYSLPIKVAVAEIIGTEYDIEFITPKQAGKLSPDTPKQKSKYKNEHNELNPKYTFDTFVVGSNNNFAHAASLAVAESPGEIYNPLFLYGGVGLGKTHLMHSIAYFITENNPDKKVLYVTSEYFTNELIEAIRNGNNTAMAKFREKYRNIDVLLIDDVQFLIGKESTQEEFFHTFNDLHGAKKQIIISSDRPPKEIETLEERLRTRFAWGLLANISAPDYETRMAILRKKEEMDSLERYNIGDDVIEYIATNIKSNIRELEGALNKLIAYANLEKKVINVQLAEEALKDIVSPDEKRVITPELIIEIVAEHFQISPEDIASSKRNAEIVYPRQISMYLCRNMTDAPLKKIGQLLGKKDHTTIIHGADKIAKEITTNESTRNVIEVIKKKINPS